jgi:hypothetical protein
MRLIFDAQNAARNHRLKNCQPEPFVCLLRFGNRWTKLFMQLKGLNGESARKLLIDLFEVFKLSWDPNSFRPHAARQGNVRA